MSLKSLMRRVLKSQGYDIYNVSNVDIYSEDGLSTHHTHSFIDDPDFKIAYARGVEANGGDHHMRWRAHVALWVAKQALRHPGAFVECGVSTGFLASAIMTHVDWNATRRSFYLFDTWTGLDPRFMSDAELSAGRTAWYENVTFEKVQANFAAFDNVHLVRGAVPETLATVDIGDVCYLSLDMNCTAPEIAAAEHFWPKMVSGGIMLLDDYAYSGYKEQHVAFNDFARRHGMEILSLPTGQGIAIKH